MCCSKDSSFYLDFKSREHICIVATSVAMESIVVHVRIKKLIVVTMITTLAVIVQTWPPFGVSA